MAIVCTTPSNHGVPEKVEELYLGRVVKVRHFKDTRNHSDTLDYSDYRLTDVTEALVWVGREKPRDSYHPVSETNPMVPVPPGERFAWVDCTNLFTWRGSPFRAPKVDMIALAIPELLEDLDAWLKAEDDKARAKAENDAAREAAQKKAREDEERNRPVRGKKMVVTRGRKVKVGTVGTVAFVSGSGSVLLKDDAKWQDRQAPGVWVDPRYLQARV